MKKQPNDMPEKPDKAISDASEALEAFNNKNPSLRATAAVGRRESDRVEYWDIYVGQSTIVGKVYSNGDIIKTK